MTQCLRGRAASGVYDAVVRAGSPSEAVQAPDRAAVTRRPSVSKHEPAYLRREAVLGA